MRDLGRSLAPNEAGEAARDRILSYFRKYPLTVVHGDELLVVSGIQDWPRRLRELRVEFGWPIVSGVTFREVLAQGDVPEEQPEFANMRPEEYVLPGSEPDRDAAQRWSAANRIRRGRGSAHDKILAFLRQNLGTAISGEELRYVASNRSEWAR